jgi:hypothetical protein
VRATSSTQILSMQALTSSKAGVTSPWFGNAQWKAALCLSSSSSPPSSRSVWCGFSRSVSVSPLREAMRRRSSGSSRPRRSARALSHFHAGMTGDRETDEFLRSVVAALGSRDDGDGLADAVRPWQLHDETMTVRIPSC